MSAVRNRRVDQSQGTVCNTLTKLHVSHADDQTTSYIRGDQDPTDSGIPYHTNEAYNGFYTRINEIVLCNLSAQSVLYLIVFYKAQADSSLY